MNNTDLDPFKLWSQAVDKIQAEIGEEDAELWLKSVEVSRLEDLVLHLKVPNQFFYDGIKKRYEKRLTTILHEISGVELGIGYQVLKDLTQVLPKSDPLPEVQSQSDFSLGDLNPRYTLSSFVTGASNRFAHATAEAIANKPGTQFNPFFIHGGVGLGKTHLLHAIGNAMRKKNSRSRVLYTTSEQFVNEFINSIQHNKSDAFRGKFRNLDCLLIDDIQFLIGKDRSEQEFFHTFNTLKAGEKQIVISSDRSPKDMSLTEKRLISRFEWGVVADIKPPDLETRIAILRNKASSEDIDVPDDVIVFVASAVKTNIRVLEGSLIRLKAFSSMTGSTLTVDDAKDLLRDSLAQEADSPVRVETIQHQVAMKYNVEVRDLKGKQRNAHIVLPRQIAMYLACIMTDLSFTDVGRSFGNKDHTTVLHAKKKILKMVETDAFFMALINKLQSDIRAVESE